MITRTASARYQGFGKEGKGHVSTQSGVLRDQPYAFGTRFGEEPGTNPEELVAAAHAACFTMALSFALAKEGFADGTLSTTAKVKLDKEGDGFAVTRSDLVLEARIDGIDADRFAAIAADAEANCPISKLLNARSAWSIASTPEAGAGAGVSKMGAGVAADPHYPWRRARAPGGPSRHRFGRFFCRARALQDHLFA